MYLIRIIKKSESISYAVLVFFIAMMSMLLAAIPIKGGPLSQKPPTIRISSM
jgi:hypothetical protein